MLKLDELVSGLASGGDDAPRFMAAAKKAPNNAAIQYPPLPYQFLTPCIISKRRGLRFWSGCLPWPDGEEGCPSFNWAGSTGERMFYFDRCIGCSVEGASVRPDQAGTAYTAFDFDSDSRDGMGSRNFLKDILIRANWANENYELVRIAANAQQNHENYLFDGLTISAGVEADKTIREEWNRKRKGVAIKIADPTGQSKRHRFKQVYLTDFAIGLWQVNGSFHAQDVQCAGNDIDIRRDNASEACSAQAWNSESAAQALVDIAGPSMSFRDSRFGPQRVKPGTGYFHPSGIFTMENCNLDDTPTTPGGLFFDFSGSFGRGKIAYTYFPPTTTREMMGLHTLNRDRRLKLEMNSGLDWVPADEWFVGGTYRSEVIAAGKEKKELFQAAWTTIGKEARIDSFVSHFDERDG